MNSLRNLLGALAFTAAAITASAENRNALALPSDLYLLPGQKADLYSQAFLKRWNPYDWFVRLDAPCEFERRIPHVATIKHADNGTRLTVDLINADDFSTVDSDTITLHVAPPATSNAPVGVQVLGDSFVQGAFYRSALVDSLFVPGIKLIGLRKLADADSHFDEGRGGWTLKSYFTISKGEFNPYNGFMQPAGDARYLGDCTFWVNCHRVIDGSLTDFESRYQCGRFENCCQRFDSQTGRALNPKKNDIMWDGENSRYIVFNGKKWAPAEIDESTWRFSYPKYLAIWGLQAPDFLFETLGLNDFRNDMTPDYTEWDSMVTAMKDSYLEANPKGIFAIVIPCSSCGSMNNRRGDFTIRQNACMWNFRKHLVSTFDCRHDEGFHLVDMGIAIDNENGYRTDSEGLQTGNPHPYPNYPAMGLPLAAFIQYYRDK